jgi:hypothetical protein
MRWIGRLAGLGVLAAVLLVGMPAAAQARPSKVLIVVLDQLRPDYVEQFGMDNVAALMDEGVSFDDAYLGHMASETVISHNVMTSGQLPKHMGWADEAFRDSDNVLKGGENAMWISGSLGRTQFNDLISHGGYAKLADHLKGTYPGTKFITVGQKNYAVYSSNGPTGDISVTLSSANQTCEGHGGWRMPTGLAVPSYLLAPCGLYYVDSSNTYGTTTESPAWMYPLDGNRYIPSTDPAHLGGDEWAAGAAMAMMDNENWSGMLVTMGAIDKISHMRGGITDTADGPTHLRAIAQTADDAVGRIVAHLKETGQYDDTLIVLTTDHAGQPATRFHGIDGPGRGDFNWYFGATQNGTFLQPSPDVAAFAEDTGNVRFSYQDSAIRTWLTDTSRDAKVAAAERMAEMPDVIATYRLAGDRYERVTKDIGAMSVSERVWWAQHAQEIVDTMAAPYAPDVVGLLKDDTSYGVAGDHGGAQKPVQRIPIVFAGGGVGSRDSHQPMRSVDITPTVLRAMGIAPLNAMDGTAYALPRR